MLRHAFANQKGGVGKTTTCAYVGCACRAAGWRVLYIDLDPQANLTRLLLGDTAVDQSLADVLGARPTAGIRDVIHPTLWSPDDGGLNVAPATGALETTAAEMVGMHGREFQLREALREVDGDYDVALLDCPPSIGQLTVNALVAADDVVAVTSPDTWSADGLGRLMETIGVVQTYFHGTLTHAGVIVNGFDQRLTRHNRVLGQLRTQLGDLVWEPPVPLRTAIGEAQDRGTTPAGYGGPSAQGLPAIYAQHAERLTPTASAVA